MTSSNSDLIDLSCSGRHISNDCKREAGDGCYQWCDSAEDSANLGYDEWLDFCFLLVGNFDGGDRSIELTSSNGLEECKNDILDVGQKVIDITKDISKGGDFIICQRLDGCGEDR